MTRILGISGYYHDSAAALVEDGHIVAAAQEERFSRLKNDARFPAEAIRSCLDAIHLDEVDYIAYYDKPFLTMERLLETYLYHAPLGFRQFRLAMPVWLKEKLFLKRELRNSLSELSGLPTKALPPITFSQHHRSHAASAFFPGPFSNAAVLCIDGVGEWATTSAWHGTDNNLTPLWQLNFPHSLGLLYSAFTYYCGFSVNSGEYKLMGLAPYGVPRYKSTILEHLVQIFDDGSFALNQDYFDYTTGTQMVSQKFCDLFNRQPRERGSEPTSLDMDLAASIQAVTNEIVLKLASTIQKETGASYLCLAGGVALNCVSTGLLRRSGVFSDVWIQPAAGDAGGAIGAALDLWHTHLIADRDAEVIKDSNTQDDMQGAYLGPDFPARRIQDVLDQTGAVYERLAETQMLEQASQLLADGKVVGWFQGRMEFGPRALGNRSILGDARDPDMQKRLNLKIKARESFRPFAPAVLEEDVFRFFDSSKSSPFMGFVEFVRQDLRLDVNPAVGLAQLDQPRSNLPAITHIDFSARLQTVSAATNPRFHALISQFKLLTGQGIVINTSFNVRGEPIVCTPEDALRCFMKTEMDYLILDNFILDKQKQVSMPALQTHSSAQKSSRATPNPRKFGVQFGLLIGVVAGVLLPFLLDLTYPTWPWIVMLLASTMATLTPSLLVPIERGWLVLGDRMNRLTSPLILGLVYFLVITPIGWVKRRTGSSRYQPVVSSGSTRQPPIKSGSIRDPF